jgi:hypothetical protein
MAHFAEGYPHFIQQFGYCAFQSDTDDIIDIIDVIKGAYGENGAIDQLGRKFFQEMYFDKISSEDYRKVLNAMADSPSVWHTRKSIMESSGVSKTQVNNALNAFESKEHHYSGRRWNRRIQAPDEIVCCVDQSYKQKKQEHT